MFHIFYKLYYCWPFSKANHHFQKLWYFLCQSVLEHPTMESFQNGRCSQLHWRWVIMEFRQRKTAKCSLWGGIYLTQVYTSFQLGALGALRGNGNQWLQSVKSKKPGFTVVYFTWSVVNRFKYAKSCRLSCKTSAGTILIHFIFADFPSCCCVSWFLLWDAFLFLLLRFYIALCTLHRKCSHPYCQTLHYRVVIINGMFFICCMIRYEQLFGC